MLSKQTGTISHSKYTAGGLLFVPLLVLQLWLAHALAFFPHEYSHSTVAWLLGWKDNPLALHYGQPSATIILLQLGINENVNYQPIFAPGHGWQAGIIAAAGMVLGNMLFSYFLGRWLYKVTRTHNSRNWGMLFYWLTVASIGNFWDYVPIRVFGNDGDMYTITRGFDCPPWLVLLVLGTPTLIALVYFYRNIQTPTLFWLFPNSKIKRGVMVVLSSLVLFSFYGAAGWIDDVGAVSRWLSMASVIIMFPAMAVYSLMDLKRTKNC